MLSIRLLVALVTSAAVLAGGTAGAGERVQLRAISTIDVGGAPSSLVVAGGAVWVSLGVDGIARIDPATSRVVARIRPGGAVVALAAGFGSIWALDLFGDRLLRIDPATNEVERATRVGGLPTGVTVGHGSVWVANQLDTTVSRVSPQTGRVLSTTRLGPGELWPGAIAAGTEGVWLVTGGGSEVSRIDPRTETVDIRLPVRGGRSLAVGRGSLWVGLANDDRLLRIDRAGMARVRVPGHRANGYGPELAGGAAVWLAIPGRVARVAPAGGLRLRLPARSHVSAIAVADDVWVAEQDAERVLRIAAEDVSR